MKSDETIKSCKTAKTQLYIASGKTKLVWFTDTQRENGLALY